MPSVGLIGTENLNRDINPYSPKGRCPEAQRRWIYPSSVIPLTGFAYPVLAIGFVSLTWFMDRVLGMHGAVLHSYDSALGVVFNIAALLIVYWPILIVIGFFLSTLVGISIRRPDLTLAFPIAYVVMCAGAIGFVLIDPVGLFEYFFD